MTELSTNEIQQTLCKEEILKGNIPCENLTLPMIIGEQDVLSVLKSGYIHEYEVKVSRSDFKADSKKYKWNFFKEPVIKERITNYFSYACPPDLINVNEIPSFSGLVYVSDNRIEVIKRPKLIHRLKHDTEKMLRKICSLKSQRQYLCSSLMTYKNKLFAENAFKVQ